jgi:hypothetical protein
VRGIEDTVSAKALAPDPSMSIQSPKLSSCSNQDVGSSKRTVIVDHCTSTTNVIWAASHFVNGNLMT